MPMSPWPLLAVALTLSACDERGGAPVDDAGAPIDQPAGRRLLGDTAPTTWAHAATYDALRALARSPDVALGEVAAYVNSEASTPTHPGELASLYYESGLRPALERLTDDRPGLSRLRDAGDAVAARVASLMTQGGAAGPGEGRLSVRWFALQAAYTLNTYLLLAAWDGLSERSLGGYDRAVGLLFDAVGAPHGLGALVARADAFCQTSLLDEIAAELDAVGPDFAAQVIAEGLPNALQVRVLEPGQSAAYEAAILSVEGALERAAAQALLGLLIEPMDASAQAAALGAYDALSRRVRAADPAADDDMGRLLDAQEPGQVDVSTLKAHLEATLGVRCPG